MKNKAFPCKDFCARIAFLKFSLNSRMLNNYHLKQDSKPGSLCGHIQTNKKTKRKEKRPIFPPLSSPLSLLSNLHISINFPPPHESYAPVWERENHVQFLEYSTLPLTFVTLHTCHRLGSLETDSKVDCWIRSSRGRFTHKEVRRKKLWRIEESEIARKWGMQDWEKLMCSVVASEASDSPAGNMTLGWTVPWGRG